MLFNSEFTSPSGRFSCARWPVLVTISAPRANWKACSMPRVFPSKPHPCVTNNYSLFIRSFLLSGSPICPLKGKPIAQITPFLPKHHLLLSILAYIHHAATLKLRRKSESK